MTGTRTWICASIVLIVGFVFGESLLGDIYFGHGVGTPGGPKGGLTARIDGYRDFASQARFFATCDYGFILGQKDTLTPERLGIDKWNRKMKYYTRGQNPFPQWKRSSSWLSDGGKCLFGLTFDSELKPQWWHNPEKQFAIYENQQPLFNQAVIFWGDSVPKKGTWGACVQDINGKIKRIDVDSINPLYPYDKTTLNFTPTTVKTLFVGVKDDADGKKDNFAQVRGMKLNLYNPSFLKNHLLVYQLDAYNAPYSVTMPGRVEGLQIVNNYYQQLNQVRFDAHECVLNDLTPFIELHGKRFYAVEDKSYPVNVRKDERLDTLTYTLEYALRGKECVKVKVKAEFGVALKGTIKFSMNADALPKGAKLGFEMTGQAELFENYLNRDSTLVFNENPKMFQTPAGRIGVELKNQDLFSISYFAGNKHARLDAFAKDQDLAISLSLPIGPESGVQSEMMTYSWYPSLTDQGEQGLAPFKRSDLELLERIDFSDPKDPHDCYDISNDPMIAHLRKTNPKLLNNYSLNYLNEPEKAKVPLKKVLGKTCRVINNNITTYCRVALKCKFKLNVPYLIVIEHAFDKRRRGTFHMVGTEPDGVTPVNLWKLPNPFGGFDTGKGPYDKKFRKESVFCISNKRQEAPPHVSFSICLSNYIRWKTYFIEAPAPEGLAIKSIEIYRVRQMPALPEQAPLAPREKRHVTYFSENVSPWYLQQFPKLAGYNSVWGNHQLPALFLGGHNMSGSLSRPSVWENAFHPGTLESQRWLFAAAEREQLSVKIYLAHLLCIGFEGQDNQSFKMIGVKSGDWLQPCIPLSPTKEELSHIASALGKSLSALSVYKSFENISLDGTGLGFFTKRNMDDFIKDTGVNFKSSPVLRINVVDLMNSPQEIVDAWIKWSCRKRFEFLSWLLAEARKYRSDIYLTLNDASWYHNGFQFNYYGERPLIEESKLKEKGIDNYYDFLKLVCHDPALYAGKDGFAFAMEKATNFVKEKKPYWPYTFTPSPKSNEATRPGEGWLGKLRDSFRSGLSASISLYDEGLKPLGGWSCQYVRDQKSYREEMIDALLYANVRDLVYQTYYFDPFRGRLNDIRSFAVPFQLLPYAQPEKYTGKIKDSAKQAIIKKYGDRYGLMNVGDKTTKVTLIMPEGKKVINDLSNGVRQQLLTYRVDDNIQATIDMQPWSLKTLEMR